MDNGNSQKSNPWDFVTLLLVAAGVVLVLLQLLYALRTENAAAVSTQEVQNIVLLAGSGLLRWRDERW